MRWQLPKWFSLSKLRRGIGGSKQPVKRGGSGKGFLAEITDTLIFQPHKSKTLPMWQNMYKLDRGLRELERDLNRLPRKRTWLTWIADQLRSAWWEFIDSVKALLTLMFFQIVTLVLVVVFNVIWFWGLFWVIGLWLEG